MVDMASMDPLRSDSREVAQAYDRIRSRAIELAGDSQDIPERARLLHSIYLDSNENHAFPQVALHGALWAYGLFEVAGTLGKLISYRYLYRRSERALRLAMLNDFCEGFRAANRMVFIDTFTNYYFSKELGRHRDACKFIAPELLEPLNKVHEAAARGRQLNGAEKRQVFEASLRWEQERTVAPRVEDEIRNFTCPVLLRLVLKPVVRFRYFPRTRYLLFKDFSDKRERIDKALSSYDLAVRAGWGG